MGVLFLFLLFVNHRPGWLVAGGITFVGVNALHGDVVGANEQAISDKTDADICAAASNPWKGNLAHVCFFYRQYGTSSLLVLFLPLVS